MARLHFGSTHDSDLCYLLQYNGVISDPFYYLEVGTKKYVFLSALELAAFNEQTTGEVEALPLESVQPDRTTPMPDRTLALGVSLLTKYATDEVVTVPSRFPVGLADSLRKQGIVIEVVEDWCPARVIKTPSEIAYIRNNFVGTTAAFRRVEAILSEAAIVSEEIIYQGQVLTSEWLRREVAKVLLDHDLVSPTGMIVSSGVQAAEPHHEGAGPIRPHSTIVVDIFPQHLHNHYFADMTRTYVKGTASDEVKQMYEAVEEAQLASLALLCPGVSTAAVYELSASVIKEHGFPVGERGYIHSLGHGLGIDVHEAPSLSARSKEILTPGQVVTIEPGLYDSALGGVRLEDTVLITETGYENLTNYPLCPWILP